MEIVEVRCEAESLNGTFDIRLDMGRGVCNAAVSTIQAIEATL